MTSWIPCILVFVLLLLNVPVAVSFFSGAIIYFTFFCHDLSMTAVIQKMLTSGMTVTFLAIPFFVTAGVVMAYGINPIQFGIILIMNQSVGGLTPPFGGIMYVCCHLCKVEIPDFVKACWPFILSMILMIILVCAIPGLSTMIPSLMYG